MVYKVFIDSYTIFFYEFQEERKLSELFFTLSSEVRDPTQPSYNPKMRRIAPISTTQQNPRRQIQSLLISSCINEMAYDDLFDQAHEQKMELELALPEVGINPNEVMKRQFHLVGTEAPRKYYEQYKKLEKIQETSNKENKQPCLSILSTSERLNLMPSKLGLVKVKGEASTLNISNHSYGDKYLQALSGGLKEAKLIQTCNLSGNRMTQTGANKIMANLGQDIINLDLSCNQIKNLDLGIVKILSSGDHRLQHLNLENNLLGDNSIQMLFNSATRNNQLKYLNLRKNLLTSRVGPQLAELIQRNGSIQELYFGTNRICNEEAKKIFQALAGNKGLKVVDYSFNKLGESNYSCAEDIADMLNKNKLLLHLDLSCNNFSHQESIIISQALNNNKKIYGIHFNGNSGYIDSQGFLIVEEQKEITSVKEIMSPPIQGFDIKFRRDQFGYEPSMYRNVCWICQGWYEQGFTFNVPADTPEKERIVYLHFDFDLYKPRLINLKDFHVSYTTMVPPRKYRYFYTFNHVSHLDGNVQKRNYDLEHQFQYEMYHENKKIMVKTVNKREGKPKKITNSWNELIVEVLPRNTGLISKREKIPWKYEDSVWHKEWKLDDDELTRKCFEKDWKNSKISNLVKNPTDQEKTKGILANSYKLIKAVYRYYSSWNPISDIWAVSANTFTDFSNFSKICSKEAPLKIIDLTFITTNSMSGADWKGNCLVPERGLVRFQFMEALVRLSQEKYKKNGLCDNFSSSIEALLRDHIIPIKQNFTSEEWRFKSYFTQFNDMLIKKYKPIFTYIYKKNSKLKVKPGEKAYMCLIEFKEIIDRIGIGGSFVLERDIYISFNTSMMTQIDELENERFMRMSFIEFVEATARVCFLLPESCRLEKTVNERTAFHEKFEWAIMKMRNTLCSDDIKNQFPNPQKSIFIKEEED